MSADTIDPSVVPGEYISWTHKSEFFLSRLRFHAMTVHLESRAPLYAAFSAAKDLLKGIEKEVKQFVESSVPKNYNPILHKLPNIQSLCRFPSDSQREEQVDFRITASLEDGAQGRFLYVSYTAANTESKPILVKFSKKPSKELHEFCARCKYAPQLLAFEKLAGGWFGIAMEYSRRESASTRRRPSMGRNGWRIWTKLLRHSTSMAMCMAIFALPTLSSMERGCC